MNEMGVTRPWPRARGSVGWRWSCLPLWNHLSDEDGEGGKPRLANAHGQQFHEHAAYRPCLLSLSLGGGALAEERCPGAPCTATVSPGTARRLLESADCKLLLAPSPASCSVSGAWSTSRGCDCVHTDIVRLLIAELRGALITGHQTRHPSHSV